MSTTFIKSNKNLLIIGAIFVASIFGAVATTQVLSSQKAEAGRYECMASRGNYQPRNGYCYKGGQLRYVKTYECWRAWGWLGPRTVCGWR